MKFCFVISFTLLKNTKYLDLSFKMDLDIWEWFGKGKTLSYTQRDKQYNIFRKVNVCRDVLMSAGPGSAVGRASDSFIRGPGFDIRSGHILSFLLPLIQEGQLSVTGESMCTKYWLIALIRGLSLPRKNVVRLT